MTSSSDSQPGKRLPPDDEVEIDDEPEVTVEVLQYEDIDFDDEEDEQFTASLLDEEVFEGAESTRQTRPTDVEAAQAEREQQNGDAALDADTLERHPDGSSTAPARPLSEAHWERSLPHEAQTDLAHTTERKGSLAGEVPHGARRTSSQPQAYTDSEENSAGSQAPSMSHTIDGGSDTDALTRASASITTVSDAELENPALGHNPQLEVDVNIDLDSPPEEDKAESVAQTMLHSGTDDTNKQSADTSSAGVQNNASADSSLPTAEVETHQPGQDAPGDQNAHTTPITVTETASLQPAAASVAGEQRSDPPPTPEKKRRPEFRTMEIDLSDAIQDEQRPSPPAHNSSKKPSDGNPTPTSSENSPTASSGEIERPWFETFFEDTYLRTVWPPTDSRVSRQCTFIEGILRLAPKARVMDLGSGLGFQATELARRGYAVTAIDLSEKMLECARREANADGLEVEFVREDMRFLSAENHFDAVICLGSTFGYFDDADNERTLLCIRNALRAGGKLLLDINNRDAVVQTLPHLRWFQGNGCLCMEEAEFDFEQSKIQIKRSMIEEGRGQYEAEYSMRLYSCHELRNMLEQYGFRVLSVSGHEATEGIFFGAESPRILIVAEKVGG